MYKALQKNKELICKALNPAPLAECEASFNRLVAVVTASMEREEAGSSDEETLVSEEVPEADMDTDSPQASSPRMAEETKPGGHVTSSSNEVLALGEVGVYDPEFLHLAFDAAMQVLLDLEAMQDRLVTARLSVEVGGAKWGWGPL